jgi:hypothetical protein
MFHPTTAQRPLPGDAVRDLIAQIVYDSLPFQTNGYSLAEAAENIQYGYTFCNFDEKWNLFQIHPDLWRDGNGLLARLIHIQYDSDNMTDRACRQDNDSQGTKKLGDADQRPQNPLDPTTPTMEAWMSCAKKLRQALDKEGMEDTRIEICDRSWCWSDERKSCCVVFDPHRVPIPHQDTAVQSVEVALITELEVLELQSPENLQSLPSKEHILDEWANEFRRYQVERQQLYDKLGTDAMFFKERDVKPLRLTKNLRA